MNNQKEERKAFEEAVSNMAMAASPYFKDYVFYMHLISSCKVIFDKSLPAAAGVCFKHDHYELHLNPTEIIAKGKNKEGKEIEVLGFCEKMPLQHRIGILKHEMLHIANGHILRQENRDHTKFNYATDCAINQEIKRSHLPDYAILPENFPSKEKAPLRSSAEIYYDLIDDEQMPQKSKCSGNCSGTSGSEECTCRDGTLTVDDHNLWQESEGDNILQKELTKNMLEKAADSTQKQRGNLPRAYTQMVENLTINREVNWKQVLRSIVGNKKANIRKTIMRRDRRLPNANWLKGKTKDRIFELGIISDVSASVSDGALKTLWGEIIHICELFNTPVKIVQIDTEAFKPEELTRTTKVIERKARGGTFLSPGIKAFQANGCHIDALVVTTDGRLAEDDVNEFAKLKKPVIWLIEKSGKILDNMNHGKMRAIRLSNSQELGGKNGN